MIGAPYIRVSSEDQTYEQQIAPILELFKAKNIEPYMENGKIKVFQDKVSGRIVPLQERDGGKQLLNYIRNGKIQVIGVWKINRVTREGSDALRDYLKLLKIYNIRLVSVNDDALLNSDNDLVREILISVIGYMDNQFAMNISKDTKRALNHIKTQIKETGHAITKQGKSIDKLGRPATYTSAQEERIKEMWNSKPRPSYNKIARDVGLNVGTVYRYINQVLTNPLNSLEVKIPKK